MRPILIFALSLLLSLIAQVSYAYDTSWSYKTELTINNNSGSSLSGRPIRIRLTSSSMHSDYAWSSDGRDLRITGNDETTELDFEIESWNAAAKTASIVLRITEFNGSSSKIFLFYGNPSASSASINLGNTTSGILYHTRYNRTDPSSRSNAESLFNASGDNRSGYGKAYLQNFTLVQNSSAINGGITTDYILLTESTFIVEPGQAGWWRFRAGMDFGLGSSMSVDNQSIHNVWTGSGQDIWWNQNWADPDVIQGRVYLSAGPHKLTIIGAEGSAGGPSSIEFSSDDGRIWQQYSTSALTITSETGDIYDAGTPMGTSSENLVPGVDLVVNLTETVNYLTLGSSFDLSLVVKNQAADSFSSKYCSSTWWNGNCLTWSDNVTVSVALPGELTSAGTVSGTDWSCQEFTERYRVNGQRFTRTTGWECAYIADVLISGGESLPPLRFLLTNSNTATTGDELSVNTAVTIEEANRETVTTNNASNADVYIVDGYLPAASPSCSGGIALSNGLWTRFFDTNTSSYANSTAQMQALVDNYANDAHFYGQTIFPDINGSGNPFDNDGSQFGNSAADEYYLTIFKGYLYIPTAGIWRFGVDGDDAVELRIGDVVRTSRYGANSESGSVQNIIALYMEAGYHRLEYRHQEVGGNDTYYLYSRAPGSSGFSITSASNFFQCDIYFDLRLSSGNTVISDPVNNTSNPKAIPGAVLQVIVTAENHGALTPDSDSLTITQNIPENAELSVSGTPVDFVDGSGSLASGLVLSSVLYSDSVLDSNSPDSAFLYTPGGEFDENVRTFRLKLSGTINPANDANYPQFFYRYRIRLK